jgi:hypothetical protein
MERKQILAGMMSELPASLAPRLNVFSEHLQGFQEVRELAIPIQGLKFEVEAFHLDASTFRPADQSLMDSLKKRAEATTKP